MKHDIEAIFIDTGNTMRIVKQDPVSQLRAMEQIAKLVGVQTSPEAFHSVLDERYEAYKKWAKETLLQVSEVELWTHWMLPDYPDAKISSLAENLTQLWQQRNGRRVPRPEVKPTIIELSQRGYTLGIIANTLSKTEIPLWLKTDGLAQYFKSVILSSNFGRRKPDPYIYLEAARVAGIDPAKCAYVGDNPSRDITGARQAGYGMVIILLERETLEKEAPSRKNKPDGIIGQFSELLNLFFPRS
ncbi:MAG: HAD family hydrolase [Chloroflexi bacterium]|nr:MAG: HAD family hydrolase [Chloroflexota bacterium]